MILFTHLLLTFISALGGALVGGNLPWPLLAITHSSATAGILPIADLGSPAPGTFEPWLINAAAAVALVGGLLWTWNQAKDAFGRKPAVDEELAAFKRETEQKLDALEEKVVTHDDLDSRLDAAASEIERKFEKALHDEFKQLQGERSRSVGNLHEKIESSKTELRAEISVVSALVQQMRGEMNNFFRGAK